MKKHIALFMIVLTAVAVVSTAGVATAAKKEKTLIADMGVDQQWTGKQCNVHSTSVSPSTTAQHTERSNGDTATFAMKAKPGQTGEQRTEIGVLWTWDNVNNWDTDQARQITVTIHGTYSLAASGGDPQTKATIGTFPGAQLDQVTGSGDWTATLSNTVTTTVGAISRQNDNGDYTGTVYVWTDDVVWGTSFTTLQQASGSVTIDSISVDFV